MFLLPLNQVKRELVDCHDRADQLPPLEVEAKWNHLHFPNFGRDEAHLGAARRRLRRLREVRRQIWGEEEAANPVSWMIQPVLQPTLKQIAIPGQFRFRSLFVQTAN